MMINSETKIDTILRANPDALEAIVSINPKFNKLRNPVMRALMAPRASLSMASKVGNCSVEDFYNKLEPLGFKIDRIPKGIAPVAETMEESPDWEQALSRFSGRMETLDVRDLEMPKPMLRILDALELLPENHALFVYHKRVPVFLIPELKERMMDFKIKPIREGEVHMLIYRF